MIVIVKDYYRTIDVGKAYVKVTLADAGVGTITRYGRCTLSYGGIIFYEDAELHMLFKAYDLLESYLNGDKVFLQLDDGRRVPACNVKEISPIFTSDHLVTYKLTQTRDWGDFPFIYTWTKSLCLKP